MPNTVFRGPVDRQPHTVTDRAVSGALLPCTGVFIGANLSQATSATGGRLALLGIRDYYVPLASSFYDDTDPLKVAYASGDGGVAYILEPGFIFQWAMAAGTYTRGQELTVGTAGRLRAATAGQIVVAHFDAAGALPVTMLDGVLADVSIANFYTK
ncbi:hypothetical protein [Aquabacterium sp. OR-4]|uniref:hypothetical protein n=1 Tax=Aquabacterium sp. OR-4 TaxID=2978127 RepID=UPI0021B23A45|nr:hypothetical protein [Aquabacterium sp. OR-4]MDT7836630.1 hypothetical protein [Aquabacterium sp. OR-4]